MLNTSDFPQELSHLILMTTLLLPSLTPEETEVQNGCDLPKVRTAKVSGPGS